MLAFFDTIFGDFFMLVISRIYQISAKIRGVYNKKTGLLISPYYILYTCDLQGPVVVLFCTRLTSDMNEKLAWTFKITNFYQPSQMYSYKRIHNLWEIIIRIILNFVFQRLNLWTLNKGKSRKYYPQQKKKYFEPTSVVENSPRELIRSGKIL